MPDREVIPYLAFLSVLFSAAFLAGVLSPPALQQGVAGEYLRMIGPYRQIPGGALFLAILLNNVIGTLLVLLGGILLGILPVLSAGGNGFLFGILYRHATETAGYGKAALEVLPHGIVEIAAFLFAAAYGMWLGAAFFRRLRRGAGAPLLQNVVHAVRRYFAVAFPLLIVASALETAGQLFF